MFYYSQIFFTYFTLLHFSPSESLNSISITNSICQGFNSVISDLWAHSTKTRESTRIVVVTLDEYKTLINSKINMCSENLNYYLHYYGSRHRSKNLWNWSVDYNCCDNLWFIIYGIRYRNLPNNPKKVKMIAVFIIWIFKSIWILKWKSGNLLYSRFNILKASIKDITSNYTL